MTGWVVTGVAMAFSALVVIGALVRVGRLRRRVGPVVTLARAEAALVARHPRTAQRHAQRVLRKHGDEDYARFIVAASLIQEGRYAQVVSDLEGTLNGMDAEAACGFAFLLAVAHARLGNRPEAAEWARAAWQEPQLRARLHSEPALAPILEELPPGGPSGGVDA